MVSGVWSRAGFAARVVATVLLGAADGHADEVRAFSLEWQASPGCPTQETLRLRVEQLLGERGATAAHSLTARESVSLLPDGRFHAELTVVEPDGERTRVLEAATCTEVAEASAVVLALAISPPADAVESPTTQEPAALSAPSAEPPNPSALARADTGVAPSSEPSKPARMHVTAALGAAVDFATATTAAPGVALAATAGYRRVRASLRGSFFPARSSTVPDQPSQGVSISLLALAPLICVEPFTAPVELAACAEFEFGRLHATGFGPPEHYERSSTWLAPGGGLTAVFPRRGPLRSRFGVDLLVPLAHTEFVLQNVGIPHEIPSVDPRVSLALEVAFP